MQGNKRHARTGLNMEKAIQSIVASPERTPQFKQAMAMAGVLNDLGNGKFGLGDLRNLDPTTNPMFNSPVIANEFLAVLTNKVGKTWVWNKMATNDLAMFKSGEMPWGAIAEEIHINPAEPYQYDPDGKKRFGREIPDVKVAYHQLNRQEQFKVTVQRELLKRAFTSYEGFGELVDAIINSMYNGNTIKEYLYTKQLMGSAYKENKIVKMQIDDPEANEANAKAFTAKMRALSKKFKRPTTLYNAYTQYTDADKAHPRYSWVEPENQVIVISDDLEAYLDVNILAYAFNMSRAELEQRIVTIDQFEDEDGTPLPDIKAMIMDRAYVKIETSDEVSGEEYDPAGLFFNHFLTLFQTYSVSPFANAVALTTEAITARANKKAG